MDTKFKIVLQVGLVGLALWSFFIKHTREPQPIQPILKLEIATDKSDYIYKSLKPFSLHYKLTNVSKKEFKIAKPFGENGFMDPMKFGASIELKDIKTGFPISLINSDLYGDNIYGGGRTETLVLQPGEFYEETVDDIMKTKERKKHKDFIMDYAFENPGEYELSAKYFWPKYNRDCSDCLRVIINSNAILVNIK